MMTCRRPRAVYGLKVVQIPTNRPLRRRNLGTRMFVSSEPKWEAVVESARRHVRSDHRGHEHGRTGDGYGAATRGASGRRIACNPHRISRIVSHRSPAFRSRRPAGRSRHIREHLFASRRPVCALRRATDRPVYFALLAKKWRSASSLLPSAASLVPSVCRAHACAYEEPCAFRTHSALQATRNSSAIVRRRVPEYHPWLRLWTRAHNQHPRLLFVISESLTSVNVR
jgi:hypothetical protein